jgi:phenylacetate-CoA ligase
LHYGIERLGASIIPASSGNTQRQLMLMHDLESTVLVCTPSYSLHLAEALNECEYGREEFKLRIGLFGGEFWGEGIRQQIEAKLGISATDNYGLSEITGPGVSGECQCKNGMHIFEDYFYPETIDPDTGQALPYGEKGELVLTTLAKEALPILRYRTRDVCRIMPEPCACGRTFLRMTKVEGRTDDMLIIRGANVFPSQIEEVLMRIEGTAPHYQLVIRKKGYLDDLEVKVEVSESLLFDEMKQMQVLKDRITQQVREVLGIQAKITLVEPKSIERSVGKAKRVLDLRQV